MALSSFSPLYKYLPPPPPRSFRPMQGLPSPSTAVDTLHSLVLFPSANHHQLQRFLGAPLHNSPPTCLHGSLSQVSIVCQPIPCGRKNHTGSPPPPKDSRYIPTYDLRPMLNVFSDLTRSPPSTTSTTLLLHGETAQTHSHHGTSPQR